MNHPQIISVDDPSAFLAALPLEQAPRKEGLLLDPAQDPLSWVEALLEAGCERDAARVLARLLQPQTAVAWAWTCARWGGEPSEAELHALAAVEEWLERTDSADARRAHELAQSIGYESPVAWCATAAFWGAGNLAPEGQGTLPVPDGLVAKAVTGSILLAAVRGPREAMGERYATFLDLGLRLARAMDEAIEVVS